MHGPGAGGCMVLRGWVHGPDGVHGARGVCVHGPGAGGAWSWGCVHGLGGCMVWGVHGPGGVHGGDTPTATAAGGTHPTGMHSCFICLFERLLPPAYEV